MTDPRQHPAYPPPPAVPVFTVRTVKHSGALIIWINQSYTVTGTYAQCQAAIDDARRHCLLAGWWSIGSLLWNPIALAANSNARKSLIAQAHHAHQYALWWHTYYGGGPAASLPH